MEFFNVFPLISLPVLVAMIVVKSIALNRNGVTTNPKAKKGSFQKYLLSTVFIFVGVLILLEFIQAVFDFSISILPKVLSKPLFVSIFIKTLGAIIILLSPFLMIWTLRDFKSSLRFGLDSKNLGKLITTGIFSISRNPFFISIEIYFLGVTFIFFNLFFLLITLLTIISIHIFILKEEKFLLHNYGDEYKNYIKKVRRYF